MSDAPNPVPDHYRGPIAHLVVDNAAKAIEFYKNAFDAEELFRMPAPDGQRLMHAQILIDGAPVYLVDDFPEMCEGRSRTPTSLGSSCVTIHRYVPDVDAAVEKARVAGASVTMPSQDMFWGDRYARVEDPFGHHWSLATHVRDVTPEEMTEAARNAFG